MSVELVVKLRTQEVVVLLDVEQAAKVARLSWTLHPMGYLQDKRKRFLHHIILERTPSRDYHIVHLNGNKLDNRKENLEVVERPEVRVPRYRPLAEYGDD